MPRPAFPLRLLAPLLLALSIAGAAHAVDADRDTLDDGLEWTLAVRHAPVVYLHPSEWNYPVNVDWFLSRARMRFHHDCSGGLCCDDHGIFDYGGATQASLVTQVHSKRGWSLFEGCHHHSPQSSGGDFDDEHHFFLQLRDADHSGSWYSGDWKVYTHVYPGASGGINVQYWFFYAYNSAQLNINHEGDWENVLVQLDAGHNVIKVLLARHNDPYHQFSPGSITWFQGTHPVVLSALGTHATYESFSACSGSLKEHGCAWGDPSWRWFTWSGGRPAGQLGYQGGGLVPIGEKAYPLNGQSFVKYSGTWGEIGDNPFGWTTGPRGPAYQDKWNYGRASTGGTGGTGGSGGDCDDGGEISPTVIIEPC